jgi:flagellar biosynthesis protein FlhF
MPQRSWPGDDVSFLAEVLRTQHAPESLIERLASSSMAATPRLVDRLAAALGAHIHFLPLEDALRSSSLLLLGPPGAGKSTLAAKLAARLGERRVLVVSTDTARPGGVAQLEEYMTVLGLPLAVADSPTALEKTVAGAAGRKVIIDTVGSAPHDVAADQQLGAFIAAAGAEPVLALPAGCTAEDAAAMARAAAAHGARSLIVTRLDLVRRIGAALAAAEAGRLALVAASVTPHFAFGLRELTPDVLARRLLQGALHEERWRPGAP